MRRLVDSISLSEASDGTRTLVRASTKSVSSFVGFSKSIQMTSTGNSDENLAPTDPSGSRNILNTGSISPIGQGGVPRRSPEGGFFVPGGTGPIMAHVQRLWAARRGGPPYWIHQAELVVPLSNGRKFPKVTEPDHEAKMASRRDLLKELKSPRHHHRARRVHRRRRSLAAQERPRCAGAVNESGVRCGQNCRYCWFGR
jgi:hypothetical protein